jgi:FMN phosphatase YigB (HAD superfamily)
MHPRYRALSLDLGETVWWDTPEHGTRQDVARARVLAPWMLSSDGRPIDPGTVLNAWKKLRLDLLTSGRSPRFLATPRKIQLLLREMDAQLTRPLEEVSGVFAFAGLDTSPPTINPEALRLVSALNRQGVPVVAISNTQRTGDAWSRFLLQAGMTFQFVITSSDREIAKPDPRLFAEAAMRLHLPPSDVLHVGDRWETDVVGALTAGMGAALYRGLWNRQWDREEGTSTDPGTHPEVPRWDDLGAALEYFPVDPFR